MEIKLTRTMGKMACFSLHFGNDAFHTSGAISRKFGLHIEAYNKRLIEKVIQRDEYKIVNDDPVQAFYLDIVFPLSNKRIGTYVNKFKEEFANELILLKMEEGA